jgi:hypothetical protein
MPAPLHPLARRPVAEFLRLADARLPGVVQGWTWSDRLRWTTLTPA